MRSWSNPASCQHYTCHGRQSTLLLCIKHLPAHLHSKCRVSFSDVNLFFSVCNAPHAMNTTEREKSSAQIIVQNPVRADDDVLLKPSQGWWWCAPLQTLSKTGEQNCVHRSWHSICNAGTQKPLNEPGCWPNAACQRTRFSMLTTRPSWSTDLCRTKQFCCPSSQS